MIRCYFKTPKLKFPKWAVSVRTARLSVSRNTTSGFLLEEEKMYPEEWKDQPIRKAIHSIEKTLNLDPDLQTSTPDNILRIHTIRVAASDILESYEKIDYNLTLQDPIYLLSIVIHDSAKYLEDQYNENQQAKTKIKAEIVQLDDFRETANAQT